MFSVFNLIFVILIFLMHFLLVIYFYHHLYGDFHFFLDLYFFIISCIGNFMALNTPMKKFFVFFMVFLFQLFLKIAFDLDGHLLAAGGDSPSSSESSSAVQPKSSSSSSVPLSVGGVQVDGSVSSPSTSELTFLPREVSTPNADYVRPASLEGSEASVVSASSGDARIYSDYSSEPRHSSDTTSTNPYDTSNDCDSSLSQDSMQMPSKTYIPDPRLNEVQELSFSGSVVNVNSLGVANDQCSVVVEVDDFSHVGNANTSSNVNDNVVESPAAVSTSSATTSSEGGKKACCKKLFSQIVSGGKKK